jgi:hypothetical protein
MKFISADFLLFRAANPYNNTASHRLVFSALPYRRKYFAFKYRHATARSHQM